VNRSLVIYILSFVALFSILYFGFDTKPSKQAKLEENRALSFESTDIRVILAEAKDKLSKRDNSIIGLKEQNLQRAQTDSATFVNLENLAREWYALGYPEISAHYAEEIAKERNDADSWSIAGTTFTICVTKQVEDKVRSYCNKHAKEAFENAISIEPDNIDHRINLSVLYTEAPPKNNPMQGILMLREMNEANPEEIKVLNQLARLSIRTNQWDNALKRLSQVLTIKPDNQPAICMIAKVYQSLQDFSKAADYQSRCIE